MRAPRPKWQKFEEAVAAFIRALDPSANVQWNVRVPDRDTGRARQRDVWIEARLFGHFPIVVMVSCKRYMRKLNQRDLDAFIGELESSGATMGILYSYSGFGVAAVEKAAKRHIPCCRLFEGTPPEIPRELQFPSYCYTPQVRFSITEVIGWTFRVQTWEELCRLISPDFPNGTVLDAITAEIHSMEKEVLNSTIGGRFHPREHSQLLRLRLPSDITESISIRIFLSWNTYRGDYKAYLINGSYSETDKHFAGTQTFPSVDMRGSHPGVGWILVDSSPAVSAKDNVVQIILSGGDLRGMFLNSAYQRLPDMQLEDGAIVSLSGPKPDKLP